MLLLLLLILNGLIQPIQSPVRVLEQPDIQQPNHAYDDLKQ